MAECTGQCVGLTIRQSRVRFLLWPLAGFVLNCSKFKSSATLVNSQLVQPPSQLGFLILICSICIICYRIIWVECLQTSSILFFHYNKQTFNLEPLIKLNLAYKVLFFMKKWCTVKLSATLPALIPLSPGQLQSSMFWLSCLDQFDLAGQAKVFFETKLARLGGWLYYLGRVTRLCLLYTSPSPRD